MPFSTRDSACLAVLILAPVLVLWPELVGLSQDPMLLNSGLLLSGRGGWIAGATNLDLNVGVTTQALGHLSAEQWLAGRVPWWNPYTGLGMPLAGEMQASSLFLPFVLLLHFQCGPLLLKAAMQMLAGVATFGLLLQLGVSRMVALTGGVVFGLGGSFAWLGHGPIMPIAFLPLFLWGIERAVLGRGVRMIALAVGFSIIAGFPETAYLDGLLALLWAGWRVAGAERRWALCLRIGIGGLVGLALAAPAIWSFVHFLLNGTAHNHDSSVAVGPVTGLPAAGAALLLFPYLHGALLAASLHDPSGLYDRIAPYLGGYLGFALLIPALVGCLGRHLRGLRVVLTGWIVLSVGRSLAVPGLAEIMDHVPLLAQTLVPRYVVPSWVLASVILACLAVEDARHGLVRRWQVGVGAALALAIGGGALGLAWPLARVLLAHAPGQATAIGASLFWGLFTAAAGAVLLAQGVLRFRVPALCALLAVDAVVLFTVPMLSGVRGGQVDLPAVAFLRESLGLQRFYALGVYRPNYGAYFSTGQLNHEYLPLPANWVDFIERRLDPGAHPVMFRGDLPRSADRFRAVRDRQAAFAALGVRYVVAPAGQNPFLSAVDLSGGSAAPVGRGLSAGESLSGEIAATKFSSGAIGGFGVTIGTNFNAADGVLRVLVCSGDACSEGSAPLFMASDNQMFTVPLDRPLDVGGQKLTYRLTHEGGTVPFAVWLTPEPTLRLQAPGSSPPIVYADRLLDIYELPEAAPYFEVATGDCRLSVQDRENLIADCNGPARLVRRELFFPGWRATINGGDTAITPADEILQSITLPAGRSSLQFSYAPPYMIWAAIPFWAALAALLIGGRQVRLGSAQTRQGPSPWTSLFKNSGL